MGAANMEAGATFGIILLFATLIVAAAQREQYWGSYSLSIPGGSGTGNAVKLLQLPATAPHHEQAEVVRSTVDRQREFSASQAQLIQQQIHRQSNAPQLHHQQRQQLPIIEQLKSQLKMAKFQAGMQPLPSSHVEEALTAAVDNQQEFAKQQAQLIQQQQQQQQLEIQHHIQQQTFALQQAHLIQQQQREQQQQIQDGIRQQLRLRAPTQQQTMEMVVAKQKAFQRQQNSLIEHQIKQQEMQQQHQLLLPQQHPLAAAAVAKQQEFSRQQAALVESQIQQQQLGEQQQQLASQWQQQEQELEVKNKTPAWLQEIIKKETVQ